VSLDATLGARVMAAVEGSRWPRWRADLRRLIAIVHPDGEIDVQRRQRVETDVRRQDRSLAHALSTSRVPPEAILVLVRDPRAGLRIELLEGPTP
jgi:hypothetical protein